jgi:hypothetical protein
LIAIRRRRRRSAIIARRGSAVTARGRRRTLLAAVAADSASAGALARPLCECEARADQPGRGQNHPRSAKSLLHKTPRKIAVDHCTREPFTGQFAAASDGIHWCNVPSHRSGNRRARNLEDRLEAAGLTPRSSKQNIRTMLPIYYLATFKLRSCGLWEEKTGGTGTVRGRPFEGATEREFIGRSKK